MKLAEALILRADYQKRIEQLKQRLLRNAKVQEGDKPAELPKDLMEELEQVSDELVQLIQRINKTNSASKIDADMTLSDALAVRDILRLKHGIYRGLAEAASVTQSRFSKSEVKFKSAVDISEVQKRADQLAKEHRELDTKIQEANWLVELMA
jgi:hypothetical protein